MHLMIVKPPSTEGEEPVAKPYSPISPLTQKGTTEFVIKCYPGSIMGTFLHSRKVGDKLLMSGPVGYITYKGGNIMQILYPAGKDPMRITKLALLCGGSGITPHFNLMDAIYRARESDIEVKMLYSNKTSNDILLRKELDAINADKSVPNISVAHNLTRETG